MTQEKEQSPQSVVRQGDSAGRVKLAKRILIIGAIIAVASLLYDVVYYFQEGVWQALVDAAGLTVALICIGVAYRAVKRGQVEIAAYLALLTLVSTYVFSELAWQGETVFNFLGGVLLIFIVGYLIIRHRWRVWLAAAGIYGICVLLIYLLQPPFRQNAIVGSPTILYADLGLTILLALAGLGLIIDLILSSSIRIRLLFSFVSMALLLAVVISGISAWQGFENGRQQAWRNLGVIATFKESKIEDWLEGLQDDLAAVLWEEPREVGVEYELDTIAYLRALLLVEEGYLVDQFSRSSRIALLRTVNQTRRFDELFVMNTRGHVLVSTNQTHEGQILSMMPYFQRGLEEAYIQPPAYDPVVGDTTVIAVQPILGENGDLLGVLAGRARMDILQDIMQEPMGLGETGETYLVAPRSRSLLTPIEGTGLGAPIRTQGANAAIEGQQDGQGLYENYAGEPVVGVYRWLPELQIALLAEQSQVEVFRPVYRTLQVSLGVALLAVLIAVGASLLITRGIANPLANLVDTATQIADGDLERRVEVERTDEIGALALAFNNMTAQLRNLVGTLEQRVAARTRELERRSAYLRASAEVARVASSILDVDQLTQQIVTLIRQRFDLYYVGLFLVDEVGDWAVLQAGTGEAGQRMLGRGHRIRIGEGMIGWSVAHAQARIALDIGEDAVRLAMEELPETRSEAALPLRARGRVIGALSVQSDRPAAFDEDILAVFQTMADRVAIALENARLFTESQHALEAADRAYGELSTQAWARLLRERPDVGYLSDERGVARIEGGWRPEMTQALQQQDIVQGDGGEDDAKIPLAVPITVRGSVIGVLDTYKPAGAGGWTEEERLLFEVLADQLSQALESARLYEDTQRRAAREQLIGRIVDHMRRAVDMDGLMRTTIQEISSILEATGAFVQLGVPSVAEETD